LLLAVVVSNQCQPRGAKTIEVQAPLLLQMSTPSRKVPKRVVTSEKKKRLLVVLQPGSPLFAYHGRGLHLVQAMNKALPLPKHQTKTVVISRGQKRIEESNVCVRVSLSLSLSVLQLQILLFKSNTSLRCHKGLYIHP